MKKMKLLALCLCAVIGLNSLPMTAKAEEKKHEVTVTALEELAEPTEFPAEGTMYIHVMNAVSLEDDYSDAYKDAYLPVIVDKNKTVYAELDTLAGYLGMNVNASTNGSRQAVRTVRYHNSALFLTAGSAMATYTMYVANGVSDKDSCYPYTSFSIGNAPIVYEEEFYVPLDAFLQCTGSFSFYSGENDYGKEDLYITPPQRTVLDDLIVYCREAYSTYFFSMEKDLGYTPDDAYDLYYSSEFVQYVQRFGTIFDGAAWSMALGADDRFFDDKYVDNYMDYVLHMNEEVLNASYEEAKGILDICSLFADVTEVNLSGAWENPTVLTQAIVKNKAGMYGDLLKKSLSYYNTASVVGGNALSYASICSSLYGADQISVNGADNLFNKYSYMRNDQFIYEQNVERIKKNINDYGDSLGWNAFCIWLEEYWLSNGMSFAKIMTEHLPKLNGILGIVGIASSVWSGGTSFLYGKYLDASENYMTAYFGEQYEREVIPAAKQSIYDYISGDMSEEDTRSIVYHAMAASYTARYFGCLAAEEQFIYYPDAKNRQQELNQLLTELMAVVQCDSILMGMRPQDYASLRYNEELHYDNVFFNVCQIQGQILSWENEKPAKDVDVVVTDENGVTLAEFVTGNDGKFDASFKVEDVSIFDDGAPAKQITFHINDWWYPEILETVEIPLFQKSQIDGLHAGRNAEKIKCYLEGVSEENEKVILTVRRITLDEDTVYFDIPNFFDGGYSYETYTALPGQSEISENIERLVLDDGLTFETVYSVMYPEGSWTGGIMRLVSGVEDSFVPDGLLTPSLHEADEIQTFIDAYYEINGEYPTFYMEKVNSVVDYIEPIMVITSD